MVSTQRLRRSLVIACIFGVTSVVTSTASSATSVQTSPQNPTFTVDRGSTESRLKMTFTPSAGIQRYTVRAYTSWDNYDTVAHTETNYISGADIGSAGRFSSGCAFDEICIALTANRGVRLTIQGYDNSGNAVTAESEKSIIHYPANPNNQQVTVSAPTSGPSPTLKIEFSPRAGHSSLSIRLYTSADNYSQVFSEITGITSNGRVVEVPANTTFKYRFKTIGSTTNDAVYLASDWSESLSNSVTTYPRPNPPANVVVASGDGSLIFTWAAPQSVSGINITGYETGLSTDGSTWQTVVLPASNRSSTRTSLVVGTPLVNGQPYWVRLGTRGSIGGLVGYWYSPAPIRPAWTPLSPSAQATPGDQRIDVSWSAPTNDGGSPVTEYVVEHSVDGSTWISNSVTAPTTTFSIPNLQNGTAYNVMVSARNNAGLSIPFVIGDTVTPVGSPIPKTLAVTRIGTTTATISMEVDTKGNFVTPSLQYGRFGSMTSLASGPSQRGNNVTYSTNLTGLTPGFRYQVQALTDSTAYSRLRGSTLTFTTTPSSVTGLSATTTATSAAVQWNASPTNHSILHTYEVWAEQNGVEVGNRCTVFTNSGRNCVITGLSPGRKYTILNTATAVGATYGNGTSFPSSISVATLAEQTINFSFATLPRKTTGTSLFDISTYGSSSSGLTLSYATRTSSVCTMSGTQILINTSGTCTIRATQAGNSRFSAATPVDASFIVPASQSITFSTLNIGTQTLGASTLDLAPLASASSNLTVTFTTTTPDQCSISNTTVTYLRAGTCRVIASQAGNESFEPATNVDASITVARGTQESLTISTSNGTFGTKLQIATSGGSGSGVVSYVVDTNSVSATATGCAISAGALVSTSAGTCAVIATKAQDNDYNAANSSSTLITLGKSSQIVSFQPIAGTANLVAGQTTSVTAQSTSGLSVTITSDTASLCTVSGTTVTLISDGVCTLRGAQSGNSNFLAATQVTTSFEISPKPIPDTEPIEYTRLTSPNTYRVGDTVELSVAPSTYMGLPVPGTFQFISTRPNSFSFSAPVVDEDGITRVTVTFQRANAAFNLYAVFTPTDSVTFAQGQTFAAIQVGARPQIIEVDGGSTEYNSYIPVTYSGIQSSGQVFIDFSPTTGSGQAVNISDQQAHCSLSNQTVTRDNPGSCYVRVSSMTDGVYESSSGIGEFVFTRLRQMIILSNESTLESLTATNAGDTIDLTGIVSSSASLTVTVSSLTTGVCTVSNFAVTIVTGGICSLQLAQAGNDTYLPTDIRVYNFSIARLEQDALSLDSTSTTFGSQLTLTSSGGSGTGQVTYVATDGLASGCSVQNDVLTSTSSGTCLVTVTKNGDSNYLPKSSPVMQVEVARAAQSLNFNVSAIGSPQPTSAPANLAQLVSTNATGDVSFTTDDTSTCRVNGTSLEWVAEGTCVVTAIHFGTENYEPASQQASITVAVVSQPVSPSPASPVVVPDNSQAQPETRARSTQSSPRTPKTGKRGRTIKFNMKSPSGLPLVVKASSACRSSKITKVVITRTRVRGKIVTKRSTVQTGWLVTYTKKGSCTITFQNAGNDSFLPLQSKATIKVS